MENTAGMTNGPSLVFTDAAAVKVGDLIAQEQNPNLMLRVFISGGGCSGFQYDLFFDEPDDADMRFESNGVSLVSDQMSFMYLMGTEIDYVDGLQGAGFKFVNPQAKQTCGCGSSFAT